MIRLTNRLFRTNPIVAHAPGPLYQSFQRLCQAAWSQPRRRARCDELTLLTFNTGERPAKPCGVFERSCHRFGMAPVVLGRGARNWRNVAKLRLLAEALKRVRTPYVMAADSCDVLLLDSPAVVLERFKQHFACDLVYNTTGSGCYPDLPEFIRYESSRPMAAVAHGRHWLNAGVWIGRTEFAREYYASLAASPLIPGYEHSEQAVVKREWPKWYPRVQLDYLAIMFQWINEDRGVVQASRPLGGRQRELLRLIRPLGPRLVGAEVGVWDGITSEALLRELPELELWMIDPWRPYGGECKTGELPNEDFQKAKKQAMWWTEFAGRRKHLMLEPSPSSARHFADESLDFAFIDGNHLYESVRDDIIAWWPKIRPGGLLTGHDYDNDKDLDGTWGVRRAVDEFAAGLSCDVTVGEDHVWCVRK